ncbi:MAG: glycosyltransferase [Kiritimatiellae bacterium]|nr:glycosyltransferase [Kiritimatiellia bacterium]
MSDPGVNNKAKPLAIIADRFSEFGGREIFISTLLRALRAVGRPCTLVCGCTKSTILSELEACNIRVLRTFGLSGKTSSWMWVTALPALAKVMRDTEVIIFTRPIPAFFLRACARTARPHRKRTLIFLTTIRPAEAWRERPWPAGSLDVFESVITQSPAFLSDLRRFGYKGRIHVIPYLMPDVGPVCPLPRTTSLVRIGCLGRLAPEKNLDHLLDVFLTLVRGSVRATDARYELHLWGDGPERLRIERLAKRSGLDDVVCFHGMIPHSKVFEAIDSCHLFIFTARSTGQCLAALEVLSRGRPMVATTAGALPDIITDREIGRLVSRVPDRDALVTAIKEVVADITLGAIRPQWLRTEFDRRYSRSVVWPKYLDAIP